MRRNPPRFPDAPAALPPNLSYVLHIPPSVMTLGLGNIRALLDALGHPERAFRSVVVAGTNGKGSVTAFLAGLLSANGVKTGWYSSPHVYYVSERVRIGTEPVSIDRMEAAAARIVPLHEEIPFSYFEALTAIAFLVFAEAGVDVAVLETGLGGRFDATNAVDPCATVLTSVALDHRRILGDTEEEILREKLGITRTGVPLFVGNISAALEESLTERTRRAGVPVVPIGDIGRADVVSMDFSGMRNRVRTGRRDYGEVRIPFCGKHQSANFLLALGVAEYLCDELQRVATALDGLGQPGRFEVHTVGDKTVVLDVAHNDAALMATAATLAELSPPTDNSMVLGLLQRKELFQFPAAAFRHVRRLHVVDPVPGETTPGSELLARFGIDAIAGKGGDVVVEGAPVGRRRWDRFCEQVLGPSNPCRRVLVTGSFRTVEVVGGALRERGLV